MKPTLEVIWLDNGSHLKTLPWHGPATNEDLAAYMENYFEMLANGYRPAGFSNPPRPHCARIIRGFKPLAEWYSPAQSAESLVTAGLPPGSGGIPNV